MDARWPSLVDDQPVSVGHASTGRTPRRRPDATRRGKPVSAPPGRFTSLQCASPEIEVDPSSRSGTGCVPLWDRVTNLVFTSEGDHKRGSEAKSHRRMYICAVALYQLVNDEVSWSEVGEEIVVLSRSTYYTVTGTGAALWHHLVDGATDASLVDELTLSYEVDRSTAQADVAAFLERLVDAGLVREIS